MSKEKLGEKSLSQKKADSHRKSWQNDIEGSIERSSQELGIYDRKEVEARIKKLHGEIRNMKDFDFINELEQRDSDIEVFVVGGSVRDAVLEKTPKDIDLVVAKTSPLELVNTLLKYGKITFDRNPKVDIDKLSKEEREQLIMNSYGVLKFNPQGSTLRKPIDIAFPREDNYPGLGKSGIRGIKRGADSKADPNLQIIQDLERRDLTINAMAINLINGDIFDPFDGVEDIVKRRIRTVGDPEKRILEEDLSRGFRVIRFACLLNANIDSNTQKIAKEIFKPASKTPKEIYKEKPEILKKILVYEQGLKQEFELTDEKLPRCLQVFWDREQQKPRMAVAKEVIRKEILKAVSSNPRRFVELMDKIGGLKIILPELVKLKGLKQPKEHHREGDAFRHTLMLLDNLPRDASLRLKLAGLFHDIGKADTQGRNKKDKITFYGHDKVGAKKIRDIVSRFRLPNKLASEVVWLVENHMLPHFNNVLEIKATKLENIFLKDQKLGEDLILLARADAIASMPEQGKPNLENINYLILRIEKLKKHLDKKDAEVKTVISGRDLIELGLKPGPMYKKILSRIREDQLNGIVKNRDEAIAKVKTLLSNDLI